MIILYHKNEAPTPVVPDKSDRTDVGNSASSQVTKGPCVTRYYGSKRLLADTEEIEFRKPDVSTGGTVDSEAALNVLFHREDLEGNPQTLNEHDERGLVTADLVILGRN